MKLSIENMIIKELGYCCLQKFFSLYPSTSIVARRLGVSDRAIRYTKEKVRNGKGCCTKRKNCLEEKL